MKKILLLFVALTVILLDASAQQNYNQQSGKDYVTFDFYSHEISFGYGFGSATKWLSDFENPTVAAYAAETGNFWGAIFVDYVYKFSELASVGLNYTYTGVKNSFYNNRGEFVGDGNMNIHVIMPEFKTNWLKRDIITLYSRAAAGVEIADANALVVGSSTGAEMLDYTVYNFAFQISPIGIEVGQEFAFFAEAGFGYQGTLLLGFRYKF